MVEGTKEPIGLVSGSSFAGPFFGVFEAKKNPLGFGLFGLVAPLSVPGPLPYQAAPIWRQAHGEFLSRVDQWWPNAPTRNPKFPTKVVVAKNIVLVGLIEGFWGGPNNNWVGFFLGNLVGP